MPAATELARDIPGIGRLEFRETADRREYWLLPEGGQRRTRLPSVTGILNVTWAKPALFRWAVKHGPRAEVLRNEAADRGRDTHRFVETFMATGELLPFDAFPPDRQPYLQGIARFLWERNPTPIDTELLVCHPELGYAGRLDLVAAIDDVPTLLDFKTSADGRIWPEAHVQCAAYVMADHRCGREPGIDRTMIVGISSDGGCFPVAGEPDVTRKVWASALDFYKQIRRLERALNGAS